MCWVASPMAKHAVNYSFSRSRRDFEIFLHLPQYKLSSPISQLWHMSGSCDEVYVLII